MVISVNMSKTLIPFSEPILLIQYKNHIKSIYEYTDPGQKIYNLTHSEDFTLFS